MVGDTLSGCWVTVGVLTEKGSPKTSSTGKAYCIWKLSCLDENTVSVFLFGDAYKRNCKELAGTVFALFNSTVRKDAVVPTKNLYCTVDNNVVVHELPTSISYFRAWVFL